MFITTTTTNKPIPSSTADDYKQNIRTLLREVRLSYGAGLAMSLGGFARVELNYCVPLLVQRGDRPSQGLQFGVAASFL
ncbi:Sorting and assembly machinery component 50 [Portunus trituberculatus]|uniref:Sorting and assembly machinery component 50 n=1 Tax=Portunus trituberculatus TaxID=210409 RepID=A0A5B7KKA9_PORTR|nr:Sorting and assembly machinery component 50 [Portunus trituberculatus]